MLSYHDTIEAAAAALKGGDVQTCFEFDSEWSSIIIFKYNSYENEVAKITWKVDTGEISIWEHQDPKVRRSGDLQKILTALRKDLLKKA